MPQRAFAICAHPDDIEFMMAGTLILLGRAGYELHYMTVANGSCGSSQLDAGAITDIRRRESMAAARLIGATYHPSLTNDIEIFYEEKLLRKLAAVVREVAPEIILTHGMAEYMEDHVNTCRLVLTAAFTRNMRNFITDPARLPVAQPVTVYHALPYGLRDPLRRQVRAELYVDISSVLSIKRQMLAMHRSQKEWLDVSQGLDAYLVAMEEMSKEMGRLSQGSGGRFEYAEGWTRHLHLGYCGEDAHPLLDALGPGVCSTSESS